MIINLKIRMRKIGEKNAALVLQDITKDPHGHEAWMKLKTDLVERLGLVHKDSGGILAFGELYDTFILGTGEVYLHHDTDAGALMVTASDEQTLLCVITNLSSLSSYEIQNNHSSNTSE